MIFLWYPVLVRRLCRSRSWIAIENCNAKSVVNSRHIETCQRKSYRNLQKYLKNVFIKFKFIKYLCRISRSLSKCHKPQQSDDLTDTMCRWPSSPWPIRAVSPRATRSRICKVVFYVKWAHCPPDLVALSCICIRTTCELSGGTIIISPNAKRAVLLLQVGQKKRNIFRFPVTAL